MATPNIRESLSEMDGSVADTDLVDMVKRRTREIYRVKTGRASETITNVRNAYLNDNDAQRSDPRTDLETEHRSAGSSEVSIQGLWDKISKMADVNKTI